MSNIAYANWENNLCMESDGFITPQEELHKAYNAPSVIGENVTMDPRYAAEEAAKDVINHPAHYTAGKYEVIDVIYDMHLPYPLDNVVKYIARYQYKGKPLEDLEKAQFYLNWYINKYKEEYNLD